MLPYWILFGIFALAAVRAHEVEVGERTRQAWLIVASFLLTAFIGLRYEVGPDWDSYLNLFAIADRLDLGEALARDDPGFFALMWLVHAFDAEIWLVNLVCATVFVAGLYAFAKRQPNMWLAFAVAIPYLVIVFAMSGVRQATAIGFILLGIAAYTDKKLYRFIFWVLCAALFHASALLMLIILALSFSRNRFQSVAILLISAIPAYFLLSSSFDLYIERYSSRMLQSEGTLLRVLMNFIPAVLLLFWIRRFGFDRNDRLLWRNLAWVAILCLPLLFVIPSSTALDRVSLYIVPLQILVLTRLPGVLAGGTRHLVSWRILIVLLLAVVQFVYFEFSTHGKYYIPYKVYPLWT